MMSHRRESSEHKQNGYLTEKCACVGEFVRRECVAGLFYMFRCMGALILVIDNHRYVAPIRSSQYRC